MGILLKSLFTKKLLTPCTAVCGVFDLYTGCHRTSFKVVGRETNEKNPLLLSFFFACASA
jgi:hypothetical protein